MSNPRPASPISSRNNFDVPSRKDTRGVVNAISVGIGYGWQGDVRQDRRWKALRNFLAALERQARRQVARELNKDIDKKSQKPIAPDDLKPIRIRRLRATVGLDSWPSITQSIRGSDILVFDITPTKSVKATGREARASVKVTSSNVWLEIGYAFGQAKTVFLVHAKPGGHKDLASDLQGLIVGYLPPDGAQRDVSLRNSLVNTMRKLVVGQMRADQAMHSASCVSSIT